MWTRVYWISCHGKRFLNTEFCLFLKLELTTTFMESVTALLVQVKCKLSEKPLFSVMQLTTKIKMTLNLSEFLQCLGWSVGSSTPFRSDSATSAIRPPGERWSWAAGFLVSPGGRVGNERKFITQLPMSKGVFKQQVCFELGKCVHKEKCNWISFTY